MMKRTHIALLLASLSLGGCYYDVEEELYPGSFCDVANVTWSGTIKPIVDLTCATPGCHVAGGTGPGNFTTYAGVKAKVDDGSFRSQVLVSQAMPPTGPLGSCSLQQIDIWLNAGAPEN